MKIVPADALRRLMTDALARRGVSREHATQLVDGLIETSLRGIDTHGVRLFPTYLAELDGGRCRARPELRFQGKAAAARVLDAGHALGPVAAHAAVAKAVRIARRNGVGAVAVRNSNYFGASAQYTLKIARHGMIGMSFTNSDALVAPVGGARPLFGTNPLSFAAPAEGDEVLCIDLATSQVAFTKIKQHRERGLPLEPGWAVTADGRDASEAGEEEISALLPLGGHKGQCLAMMVEIICCLLADMPFDHQLSHLYDPPFDQPRLTSHFFLALDIKAFQDLPSFRRRLSQLMALVRAEGREGVRVLAPGDLEAETFAKRRSRGISLAEPELTELRRINGEAAAEDRVEL